jgi:hypothetical protein
MKWGTFFGGAWNGIKFVYEHPQVLEIAAAVAPGQPGQIAAGIATVVKAVNAGKPTPPTQPPLAEPLPPPPAAPPPPPASQDPGVPTAPPVLVPEVDIVGKWRGTLDRMAMDVLGYRMAEDELYNNAKLLEAGNVAGVITNLEDKLSPEDRAKRHQGEMK